MRVLNVIDALFLLLESRKQPMHVAGLCIFELPANAGDDFISTLIDHIRSSNGQPKFPFNQVLSHLAFWKTDDQFDIDHHFYHVALPKPSGEIELMNYISSEHERKLDKSKPLWEMHFIEGLAPLAEGLPARFGIYIKIHHALADGIAAMRLLTMSLSNSPTQVSDTPFWCLSTRYRNQIDAILPIHKPALQIVKEQFGTIVPVCRQLIEDTKNRKNPYFISTFDAPKSMLNQRIDGSRKLFVRSFAKDGIVKIAKACDVTTNDIILAICSGALRRYLLSQNALPKKPLIAFVPISLRADDSAVGNQISFLLANLGTHKSNPKDRLQIIKDSIGLGKARFSRMSQAQTINYSAVAYGWAGINLATGLFPRKQAFNLIISNVPGPKETLYLNGAKLTEAYPTSVLFDGQALNITFTNFQDRIDFGITACHSVLPNIDGLLDFIETEIQELTSLVHNAYLSQTMSRSDHNQVN
ncbi:wax ester/triacylglycerol synthase family O-acyltransferase [Moraxella nasovis]|uniref:WS/DGAT/MGAT family O-acyltransferase n=1 Tax=Moraxella nasovis TaxID=2904121 RepID=UPI001F6050AA|nr:wax ester/triacylglycerol synthase family O-acyltransferase [Moraxella nasovis]UNU72893.1 wax ester/triacylglycerol synthase family O-acyltransferase [Moraxella nasovis]